MAELSTQDWVFWDGQCGMCRRAVEWVARRDTGGSLRLVAYQEAPSPPMTPEMRQACARAVHVVTGDGRVLRAGRASLHVLGRIGWGRLARVLALPPLVWGVELGYRLVASNREFFSRYLFRG